MNICDVCGYRTSHLSNVKHMEDGGIICRPCFEEPENDLGFFVGLRNALIIYFIIGLVVYLIKNS